MAQEPRINAGKIKAVDELKVSFGRGNDYFFADYRGLTVEQITALRDKLREAGAEFHVVKNNYARIAFQQMGKADVAHLLVGPTAVAVAPGDGAAAAKALFAMPKEWTLAVKGGLVGTSIYTASQAEALSKLPGRDGMLASLMGTMQAMTSKLVRTLQAVADQKAGGAAPAAE